MADITMCESVGCPLASSCYRKQANAHPYYQSVSEFPFKVVDGKTECEYYWPIVVKEKHK